MSAAQDSGAHASTPASRPALSRLVDVIEVLVFVAALVFVVFLFVNEPGATGGTASGGKPSAGATLFAANCARCHGSDGGGGIGPRLSDGAVVDDFPDADDEVKVVTNGRGAMPSFGGTLSADEIARVVAYTRTL